jgi:hypothetical protein
MKRTALLPVLIALLALGGVGVLSPSAALASKVKVKPNLLCTPQTLRSNKQAIPGTNVTAYVTLHINGQCEYLADVQVCAVYGSQGPHTDFVELQDEYDSYYNKSYSQSFGSLAKGACDYPTIYTTPEGVPSKDYIRGVGGVIGNPQVNTAYYQVP